MLLSIKLLLKFIKLINSETAPSQLAAGVCFGLIVGFSPFFTWHNLLVFLLVCLFRVNLSMFFLSSAVTALIAFGLDPVFDWFGYWLLVDFKAARPVWIWIATQPILPFFKLNNTVVMGSLATALVLFIPVFILSVWAIRQYRKRWKEKIVNSRTLKALKATKLGGTINALYEKYESFQDKWSKLT